MGIYLKDINLKGKTALITGATKGLGRGAAEAIAEAGGNVIAIAIEETFAYHDHAIVFLLENALHIVDVFFRTEGHLGEINQVRCTAGVIPAFRKGGSRCNPASTAAHYFNDLNEVVLTHPGIVAGHFLHGGRNILNDATVTRGVVRCDEIVVNRLGNTDNTEIETALLSQLGDLVRGVLRIVPPCIEEITDIVCFKNLQDTGVIFETLELKTAGSEGGTRGMAQSADGLLRLGGKINEVLVQDSQHPVEATINLFNLLMVECLGDRTGKAGVNNGSWTTRLGDQTISY